MSNDHMDGISRTKTVATVGPASSKIETLAQLIEAGVNVFRLNMAHGSREDHEAAIKNINAASEIAKRATAILVDLAGPKIRLGQLQQDPLTIKNGQEVAFIGQGQTPSETDLTCTYEPLLKELKVGDAIVLADGLARLEVKNLDADRATCTVIDGGTIRSRQGVNLPGTKLSVPALGEKDKENAIWAAAQDVQFVSLSFVRNAQEICELKELLAEHGSQAGVVAKIEKQEALENLEEIVQATDAVMVARGDLGVEIAIHKTPLAQKQIIRVCSTYRKPVIVATQMLESMHTSKQPTRAEASDVANAILDGADACMLSGETAIGQYPLDAVTVMQNIMLETEQMFEGRKSRTSLIDDLPHNNITESIVYGSAQIAQRLKAEIVVIASSSGEAARLKSKQRDFIRTVCFTDDDEVLKRMSLYWGILPVRIPSLDDRQLRSFASEWTKANIKTAQTGDPIVIVSDSVWMPGVHDAIMVCRVK